MVIYGQRSRIGPEYTADDFDAKVRQLRRRRAASVAAYAMHERHPDAARTNGSKGGRARMAQIRDASAYMRWVARRRWYGELAGPPPGPTPLPEKGDGR